MTRAKYTDEELLAALERHGNPTLAAKVLGLSERMMRRHRQRLSEAGHHLPTKHTHPNNVPAEYRDDGWTFPKQKNVWMYEGAVVVFSDAHYWPDDVSLAHKALLDVITEVKPRLVVANGDVFDGGSISRHDAMGFAKKPTPVQELHACQERLGEVEQAVPRGCELLWNIGNHDQRWERVLAGSVEQFAGLHGLRLQDHFPAWEFQMSVMLNAESPHPVMVKHRIAGGIHAGYNNTLKGGITTVTSHTHGLEVKPWGDYRGRRWGVQTGSLANLNSAAFEYMENSPSPMCSGFAVLTFAGGELLPPELCEVIGDKAYFRGKVVGNSV